ncbi:MAG TPA: preprotein translocase subunit SecG [Verrucomicrobiae bacterium]|jgi:preprotein translocase subunit SecG|nr:preprotein translocase subunit SecG [Verrucomicrobiae bacterium]
MWLIWLVTTVHVIVCAILIIVVLLQHGKSADIAATFGGVGSQTAFGPRGTATLLSKLTTWCAVVFMITSITLTILSSRAGTSAGNSVLKSEKPAQSAPTEQKK